MNVCLSQNDLKHKLPRNNYTYTVNCDIVHKKVNVLLGFRQ